MLLKGMLENSYSLYTDNCLIQTILGNAVVQPAPDCAFIWGMWKNKIKKIK